MDLNQLIVILATAIATSTPLVFGAVGETIAERSGVINLSAEGTVLLSAMGGFAMALATGSVILGFAGGAAIGAIVALIVAFGAITLKQSQIAIGFVLALLCADLSSYLGNPIALVPGPHVPSFPLPLLADIPVIGPLFFQSDLLVYASYVLVGATWFYFYRMRGGLLLRSVGDQPSAAFARGNNVVRLRYAYVLIGGALMGIAGAAFSLDFKAGVEPSPYGRIWLDHPGDRDLRRVESVARGGGRLPVRHPAVDGQRRPERDPHLPTQIFNVAPFVLMILVLMLTSGNLLDRLLIWLPADLRRRVVRTVHAPPPAALGQPFEQD